jgi:hypothetical protein
MERVMPSPLKQKIEVANARIGTLLAETRLALTGEREFGVEQLRALSEPVQEMAPVVAQAAELRAREPEISSELDSYKSHLGELQMTLEQVRMMLLARRTQIATGQDQIEAVSQWAAALRQTQ